MEGHGYPLFGVKENGKGEGEDSLYFYRSSLGRPEGGGSEYFCLGDGSGRESGNGRPIVLFG